MDERRPLFALLPSPDRLSPHARRPGVDDIQTLQDFYNFSSWANRQNILPLDFTGKSIYGGNQLEVGEYNTMITTAFQLAFDPIRNACNPTGQQLVIWYYTGHGVDVTNFNQQGKSPTPNLKMNNWNGNYIYPAGYPANEPFQGGELVLHLPALRPNFGYCNLRALIQPWKVAVEADSFNAPGLPKKNKHLLIILDSCYSGMLANNLAALETEFLGQWYKDRRCSVTVQASSGSNETTHARYFTPILLDLNSNPQRLNCRRREWRLLCESTKNSYSNKPGSSPMVATTHPDLQQQLRENTDVLEFQNVEPPMNLNLFHDHRFFKFCKARQNDTCSSGCCCELQ